MQTCASDVPDSLARAHRWRQSEGLVQITTAPRRGASNMAAGSFAVSARVWRAREREKKTGHMGRRRF